jgi:hypothetical protein
MDRTYKQVIAVILSVLILAVAVYGSYLPMRKAEIFIATLQGLQSTPAGSLNELETRLAVPLAYASPIGQEELVRNMANNVLGFIQQSSDATTTGEMMSFLNGYYEPVVTRGKGMSFGQDLYLLGAINEMAFVRTENPGYLQASQHYYEEGEQFGPNRPQSLYGLFDVYRAENNVPEATTIAEKILTNWPTDQNVAQSLRAFLATASTTKK